VRLSGVWSVGIESGGFLGMDYHACPEVDVIVLTRA